LEAAKVYADLYGQPHGLDVATVTKLVRNLFMVIVIPFLAFLHTREQPQTAKQEKSRRQLLPLFVLGFLGFAVLRSVGDLSVQSSGRAFGLWSQVIWQASVGLIEDGANMALIIALAGVGLSINIRSFKELGLKPLLVGFGAALGTGLTSILLIKLVLQLVSP
jgi:uncharacterized membrane protein YadS